MRVILGYLLKEAVDCTFEYDEALDDWWISGIREYIPAEPLRRDVLYTASMFAKIEPHDTAGKKIPILLPEPPDKPLPAGFAPIFPKGSMGYRELVQALRDAFGKMEDLYLSLYKAACCGSGLDEMINMVGGYTPNHIYVADMSFKVLSYTNRPYMNEMSASWRYQVLHGYLPVHVMKGLIENGEIEALNGYHNAAEHYSESFYVPFVTRNVFYKNRPQAHVFVVNIITRPCYKDIVLGQILGDFLEQNIHILLQHRPARINSNFEDFFRDVLSGGCREEQLVQDQISLLGWNSSDTFGLSIVDMTGRDDGLQRTVMYEIESKTKWMCFHYENDLLIIADLKELSNGQNKRIMEDLAERYNLQVFTTTPFSGILDIGHQYEFLVKIRELNKRVNTGKQDNLVEAVDLAPYYYVNKLCSDKTARSLCSPDAKKLLDFDRENGTELFDTYLLFLLNDRNLVITAAELNIHRNTLVYRIEKIREMISFDDDDRTRRLHMLLSMLILKAEQNNQHGLYD